MSLDPRWRAQLADAILATLRGATSSSEAILRGSLAVGRADAYSDIDVLWEIDDSDFLPCVGRLPEILAQVRPIGSLRADPDLQNSGKHRLFFIRFVDLPLFWRLDLEVFARSVGRDPTYDLDNPEAKGADWSLTESALMNAIAAIKAVRRGKEEGAQGLLTRAYQRVGREPKGGNVLDLVSDLADHVAGSDPRLRALASEVHTLAVELLG